MEDLVEDLVEALGEVLMMMTSSEEVDLEEGLEKASFLNFQVAG